MLRRLRNLVLIAIAFFAVTYAGDYLYLRLRHDQYGSVIVQRSYEVALKNHTTEYMFDDPKPEQCVNSLFPHFGASACWWLVRHPKQVVKLDPGHEPDLYKSF